MIAFPQPGHPVPSPAPCPPVDAGLTAAEGAGDGGDGHPLTPQQHRPVAFPAPHAFLGRGGGFQVSTLGVGQEHGHRRDLLARPPTYTLKQLVTTHLGTAGCSLVPLLTDSPTGRLAVLPFTPAACAPGCRSRRRPIRRRGRAAASSRRPRLGRAIADRPGPAPWPPRRSRPDPRTAPATRIVWPVRPAPERGW